MTYHQYMRRDIKYKSRDMNAKWRGHEHYFMRGATKIMRKGLRNRLRAQMQRYLQNGNEDELYALDYGVSYTDAWCWD